MWSSLCWSCLGFSVISIPVYVSFLRLGKFLASLSSNIIFALSSLFSFWDVYNANIICLILSQRSLELPSFLFSFLSFICSASVISTNLSPRPSLLTVPLHHLNCAYFLLVYFSFQLFYSSSLFDFSPYYVTLCQKLLVSCALHPFFSWVLQSSLWKLSWTLIG